MTDWITTTMSALGYTGVALLMFLENVFPPIPSELIMPLAGFSSSLGELSFWGVVAAGTLGSLLGQFPLYYLGRYFGEARLARFADRHGRYLGVSGEEVARAEAWFRRRGKLAVLLCRFVPGVRSLISLPAGSAKMPLLPFLAYSALGMGLWALLLAYLGRVLGANYTLVETYLAPVSTVVLVSLGLGFALWLWQKRKSGATAEQE